MSLYQTVKSAITVRQVGEMYGMEPDRHGMVCCPFHSDSDPSMKLNDNYYYCFGCGANGDAIDLTAKLFDLNPRQAAEKLITDFGLDPDKPPANAIALLPPKRGLTDEQWADIAYCLRVLTDYLDLLHDWQERYKPATPEEPHDPRFEEALHTTETIEHLTDCVAFGTPQQKAAAAVYSVPLTHFSGHCSRKARPNWTSSIFLPLYQSGHKGLREMFFFIEWFSFRKVKWCFS